MAKLAGWLLWTPIILAVLPIAALGLLALFVLKYIGR